MRQASWSLIFKYMFSATKARLVLSFRNMLIHFKPPKIHKVIYCMCKAKQNVKYWTLLRFSW